MDHRVCRALSIPTGNTAASYLGIAALIVAKVHESHQAAAATFMPRRYVVAPAPTPYPPNLAHEPDTRAAVLRESCIVSLQNAHYTPDCSTAVQWRQQVKFYHWRQKKRRLRVAECRLQQVDGRDVLQLNPMRASVLTPADWGSAQMNTGGIILQAARADQLCQRIASGR